MYVVLFMKECTTLGYASQPSTNDLKPLASSKLQPYAICIPECAMHIVKTTGQSASVSTF